MRSTRHIGKNRAPKPNEGFFMNDGTNPIVKAFKSRPRKNTPAAVISSSIPNTFPWVMEHEQHRRAPANSGNLLLISSIISLKLSRGPLSYRFTKSGSDSNRQSQHNCRANDRSISVTLDIRNLTLIGKYRIPRQLEVWKTDEPGSRASLLQHLQSSALGYFQLVKLHR